MKKFFECHPGSALGTSLFLSRSSLVALTLENPQAAIRVLKNDYGFGQHSDFWDDHIFNLILSPALSRIVELDIKSAVDLYAYIDHELFIPYIRRDEDPARFRRAFWNLNSFGLQISRRFYQYLKDSGEIQNKKCISTDSNRKFQIGFAFKGPFRLAHAEFFKEFLVGCKYFRKQVDVSLILLDEKVDSPLLTVGDLSHINIISLSEHKSFFTKLISYAKTINDLNLDHLSWVACVQNISLYMGSRFANNQSYWSMKYHSIIMDSLDKYAGLGFGGDSFFFDDVHWFRGRAFPDLSLPKISTSQRDALRSSHGIPESALLAGCFVRTEKLNNVQYWELIQSLLRHFPHVHFVVASQALPPVAQDYISTELFRSRFHHLGWVDTKKWCQCLDIYIDSFPRGSCLTALEAIQAAKPVIIFDSEHNRESSALPYLNSVKSKDGPSGIYPIETNEYIFSALEKVILDKKFCQAVVRNQAEMLAKLQGRRHLYAKDYLNYFLDSSLSISSLGV